MCLSDPGSSSHQQDRTTAALAPEPPAPWHPQPRKEAPAQNPFSAACRACRDQECEFPGRSPAWQQLPRPERQPSVIQRPASPQAPLHAVLRAQRQTNWRPTPVRHKRPNLIQISSRLPRHATKARTCEEDAASVPETQLGIHSQAASLALSALACALRAMWRLGHNIIYFSGLGRRFCFHLHFRDTCRRTAWPRARPGTLGGGGAEQAAQNT